MAEQEVENGRLVRRKKTRLIGDKVKDWEAVTLADDGHVFPAIDGGLGEVGAGELHITDHGHQQIRQELDDLKAQYQKLLDALQAHGIYVEGIDGLEALIPEEQITAQMAMGTGRIRADIEPMTPEQVDAVEAQLAGTLAGRRL